MSSDSVVQRVQEICAHLSETEESLSLRELGARFGWSPFHLQRTFQRVTGVSPRQYVAALRVGRLRKELRNGDSVTNAIYGAGYGSSRGFYEQAARRLGMKASEYKRSGGGVRIGYTVVKTSLGPMLVAATRKGVCAVRLGPVRHVVRELAAEFPKASLVWADPTADDAAEHILRHLEGRERELHLPIDVKATAFQARVWKILRSIPYGETRSYGEVARAIGRPRAVRAVGRAVATNPIAIVTPCHRVVQKDGRLGGYRWGVERKRKLLEQESRR